MGLRNYTSDFNKDNSCSYFFFSKDDENTEAGRDQLRKDLKRNLNKSFASISTYWCYVLLSDDLRRLVNPAVLHKDTKEPFNGPETIWLNGIGSVEAFFSTAPILHLQHSGNDFQLVEHYNVSTQTYEVVLPALPGPEHNHMPALNSISEYIGENFSFIFI